MLGYTRVNTTCTVIQGTFSFTKVCMGNKRDIQEIIGYTWVNTICSYSRVYSYISIYKGKQDIQGYTGYTRVKTIYRGVRCAQYY